MASKRPNRKAIELAVMKEYDKPYYQCVGQPWFTQAVLNRMMRMTDEGVMETLTDSTLKQKDRAFRRDMTKVGG